LIFLSKHGILQEKCISKEKTALNQSTRSVHALMNLLFVNRRHDDVITVYNKAMHMTDNSKKNRIFFPWLELYLDALVKKVRF
jgi:hypothetical protein